jgi:transcriptional regulator with XRE-family HTH domain
VTVAVRCRTYEQLTQALAARRRQLGLTQNAVDQRSGLQDNYTGKLEIGTRHLGKLSLPMLCAALDVDILVAPRSAVAPVIDRVGSADGSGYGPSRAATIKEC